MESAKFLNSVTQYYHRQLLATEHHRIIIADILGILLESCVSRRQFEVVVADQSAEEKGNLQRANARGCSSQIMIGAAAQEP